MHVSNIKVMVTFRIKEEAEIDGKAKAKWNFQGHLDRIVTVDFIKLGLFARLYDSDDTPALQARLPALHSKQLVAVLEKFARQPKRLNDFTNSYYATQHWNEVNAQNDGTILRKTQFPKILHNGLYLVHISLSAILSITHPKRSATRIKHTITSTC